MEIIFISSDRDQHAFDEYYTTMPWLALQFDERSKKQELTEVFHVTGIPTLILLDGDSAEVICRDARDRIQHTDTKGERFPWRS
jgi:nucleoredoxin